MTLRARQLLHMGLNFDVGHTDPQLIIPFGVQAEISAEREEIRLLEPVFAA